MNHPTPLAYWIDRLGYTKTEAASALGMSRVTLNAYLKGQTIPRYVALACAAIEAGLEPKF